MIDDGKYYKQTNARVEALQKQVSEINRRQKESLKGVMHTDDEAAIEQTEALIEALQKQVAALGNLQKEASKDALKEALQEWLDKQFANFGKWTFTGLVSAAFAGLVYLWLTSHGWVK